MCLLTSWLCVYVFCGSQGHGMTVAALEVAKLDELLAAHQSAAAAAASNGSEHSWLAGLSGEYQQAITPIIQRVWELSVGEGRAACVWSVLCPG